MARFCSFLFLIIVQTNTNFSQLNQFVLAKVNSFEQQLKILTWFWSQIPVFQIQEPNSHSSCSICKGILSHSSFQQFQPNFCVSNHWRHFKSK